MKVVFDYQIFAQQRYGGISRYITRLAGGLSHIGCDVRIVAPIHVNEHLRELSKSIRCDVPWLGELASRRRISYRVNEGISTVAISWISPNVLHETYYSPLPTVRLWKGPRILTVHDMIHEKFAGQFLGDLTTDYKRKAVQRADHIIAVSQCTKDDLCEIFGVDAERVTVVHHGFDVLPVDALIDSRIVGVAPFLLYVGGRSRYKNFSRMLGAIAARKPLIKEFDVLAFGGGEFDQGELDLIRSLGFRSKQVRQISGSDGLLGALYRNATAFVYPSIYEGFGLPPLEAMALDCPVVASSSSCIPEVLDFAAHYCDPEDIDSMGAAMEKVAYDKVFAQDLVARGKKRVREFSWQSCAQRTANVYAAV